MKLNCSTPRSNQGLTILELTIVVIVLLTLVSILFLGAKAYKDGADRSNCIINQRNVQTAVRSYQNMWGMKTGDDLDETAIFGSDAFINERPECPSGGAYALPATIPPFNDLVFPCTLAGSRDHSPSDTVGW